MLHDVDLERIPTADGSTTLRHRRLGVLYRSAHGACIESDHVFIRGAMVKGLPPWRVLELGFGEARNFRGAVDAAYERGATLLYCAVDHEPIPPGLVMGDGLGAALAREALAEVRRTGEPAIFEQGLVRLVLHPKNWADVSLEKESFDAVFHDPFAPAVNPEAWTQGCFSWSREAMSPSGILATYSAAGHVRRAMARAGLFVAVAAGPGKKREITFASPSEGSLGEARIKYRPC